MESDREHVNYEPCPFHRFGPMGRLGCRFALIPERLLSLPPGELLALALLLSAWRPRGALNVPFRLLGESLGFCSRTTGAHVASLRARGLIRADVLAVTPKALPSKGEHFAKVPVDRAGRLSPAAFRTFAWSRRFTDPRGRRRVSWRWLADRMGVSRRTVTSNVRALREAGVRLSRRVFRRAAQTFPSLRRERSRHSREHVSKGLARAVSGTAGKRSKPLTRAGRERERLRQLAWIRDRLSTA